MNKNENSSSENESSNSETESNIEADDEEIKNDYCSNENMDVVDSVQSNDENSMQ